MSLKCPHTYCHRDGITYGDYCALHKAVEYRQLDVSLHKLSPETYATSSYRIDVRGRPVGIVSRKQRESYHSDRTGSRLRYGFRGYSRWWEATYLDSETGLPMLPNRGEKHRLRFGAIEEILAFAGVLSRVERVGGEGVCLMPSNQPATAVPIRYALNVASWQNRDCVIARSMRDLFTYIESEVDDMDEGETRMFTVTCVRKTDEEMDALPEWDGP